MGTCRVLYSQLHQFPSGSAPRPVPASLRRRFHHHQNVCCQFTMRLSGLALRRIAPNQNHSRFNRTTATGAVGTTNHLTAVDPHKMAEESKNKDILQGKIDPASDVREGKEEKDEASDKSAPAIPPPPEKPLPGDCCGSGCVSCVWDLYYEELEEYNRLYKADSN